MKPMQSFLIFFYILDQGYNPCNNDDLGGFLGMISPEIWGNGLPIDMAVFHDWERFSNPETVDMNNIKEKTYSFIEYYERQWGFDFSETKQWFLTAVNEAIVEKAYAKTQLMYEKYQYAN
ncbi:MAG: hypothetical protein K2O32_13650 [Acetatifactor sp.]|nr:hypothetical protein [Acetatifactor sp.]